MKNSRLNHLLVVAVAVVGLLAGTNAANAQTGGVHGGIGGGYKTEGTFTRYMYSGDIQNYCRAVSGQPYYVYFEASRSQWGCSDVGGAGLFWIDNYSACQWQFGSFNLLGGAATSSDIECAYYS